MTPVPDADALERERARQRRGQQTLPFGAEMVPRRRRRAGGHPALPVASSADKLRKLGGIVRIVERRRPRRPGTQTTRPLKTLPQALEQGVTRPVRPLRGPAFIALLVLLGATALPELLNGALLGPWRLILSPGSGTCVAASLLALTATASFLPRTRTARAAGLAATGAAALLMTFVLGAAAVKAGAFDGQPALLLLLGGPAAPRLAILVPVFGALTALFWRSAAPEAIGPTVVLATAIALGVSAFAALNLMGGWPEAPLFSLPQTMVDSPFRGDRYAAAAALLPLPIALGALLATRGRRFGWLALWAATSAPLMLLAVHVAPLAEWPAVLEPLKVVSLATVALLLLPAGLGVLLAEKTRATA